MSYTLILNPPFLFINLYEKSKIVHYWIKTSYGLIILVCGMGVFKLRNGKYC